MTARQRQPGQEAELHAHQVISRARAAVPQLATESLDRIRALVERALAAEEPGDDVIAELARTLDQGA